MHPPCNLSAIASLIAEPDRASILMALCHGRARPAGELAYAAGVTPQTASSHLAKLVAGGLLAVEAQGRHRYFRLANAHVALTLEQLASIIPAPPVRDRPLGREARALRFARCCYDHLAGQLGVCVADALQRRGYLVATDRHFTVTPSGRDWFAAAGIDMGALHPTKRGLAPQCLDWTERTHHLAGPLGRRLFATWCATGWLRRSPTSRAVLVTPPGVTGLRQQLGVDAAG